MTGFLRKRVMLAAAAMAAVAGIATFQLFDPNLAGNPFPACVFLAVTDLYCAGCGITRALHALAHGDLLRAVQMNVFDLEYLRRLDFNCAGVGFQYSPRKWFDLAVDVGADGHGGWYVAIVPVIRF